MNKLNFKLLLFFALVATVMSCKKKGCTDPLALNYDSKAEKNENCEYANYTVPSTYAFTDANDSSTVSYGGQTDRMDMLSTIVKYLKTANGTGAGSSAGTNAILDELTLHNMYSNDSYTWDTTYYSDSPFDMNNQPTKDLESKTAGSPTIQQKFKDWMTQAANASTMNTNTGYFQDSSGKEWTQLIEKGLMGACFAFQITENYLTDTKIGTGVNNLTPAAGKFYTLMEHHWDEGYGYFTDAIDYPISGTNRFWGKYTNKSYMGDIGENIATAFRTGRAAITASRLAGGNGLDYHADVLAQRDIIKNEVYKMAAGMAIHYLYDTQTQVDGGASQNSINHSMSEAYAFMFGLHTLNGGVWESSIAGMLNAIDLDFEGYTANETAIEADIAAVAALVGITNPSSFQ